jgi:hypothetical protein
MSKETPKDGPRQQSDWATSKQTDKPWERNPEKEQRSGTKKSDPDQWQETNTHQPELNAMGIASYEIIGSPGAWRVSHDGKAENVYETKEAAFEAALAAASLALRQGHEVRVFAPASSTATGAAKAG